MCDIILHEITVRRHEMRTVLKYIGVLLLLALLVPAPAGAQVKPLLEVDITAASAILVDAYTGEVLFEKQADWKRYPEADILCGMF